MTEPTTPASPAELERRLAEVYQGEFEIVGLLGTGGFAAVFRARDPVLERDVAIKVVDLTGTSAAGNRDRFLEEARTVATVEHPHIVPLHRAEIKGDLLCLIMRLVPGRSLAERIAEGPLAPADAVRIAREVAQALAAAHRRGVVHRDIKPENILLDDAGHALLTDFGISLVTGRDSARVPGMAIGTPQYLSPEQALGEAVDGRADVYSLGVVLYEMLSGRLPFEARTTAALLSKQILEQPPALEQVRPDLPAALVTATSHALAKAAGARPTAEAFAAELAEAGTKQALVPPSVVRRRRRWRRIRWTVAALVLVAGIITVAIYTLYFGLTTYSGGAQPALNAAGANIPPDLLDLARAEGSVLPNEAARFAFVPHGKTWDDALILTEKALIRRTPAGPRRQANWLDSANLTYFRRGADRGLIIFFGSAPPDTIYRGLSGAELGALMGMLSAATADTVPGAD
ncbi:MAG: serine/threonine-protein kinase [Gemmatimonadales bacterium]